MGAVESTPEQQQMMKRCHQRIRALASQTTSGVLVSACIALFAAYGPRRLQAQSDPNATAPPRNRYLLIVETSRSMKNRVPGLVQAAQDLLGSRLDEVRPGDTLGLWTFNEALYAGRFPLQDFSPQTQQAVAARVASYLQSQKYEKQANLEKVLPQVQRLIAHSEFLTVVLVSTGNEEVHGTPIDAAINGSYKQWRDKQQAARMPLLTVLRGQRGKITDFSVNQAPWPVELPPLPPEFQRLTLAKKQSPSVAPSTAEALLESVRKAESAPPAPVTPAPATFAPVTPAVTAPAPTTITPATITSTPAPQPVLAAQPVQVAKAPITPAPTPSQAKAPVSPQLLPAPTAPGPAPGPPPKVAPSQTPANSLPRPFRQIVATNLDRKQPAGPSQPLVKPSPAITKAATPSPTKTAPAPQAPAGRPQPAPASTTPSPKAQVAAASTWQDLLSPRNLWIAGGCFAALLLLVVVLVLRARSRKPFHISLITQSVDKK